MKENAVPSQEKETEANGQIEQRRAKIQMSDPVQKDQHKTVNEIIAHHAGVGPCTGLKFAGAIRRQDDELEMQEQQQSPGREHDGRVSQWRALETSLCSKTYTV